MKAMTLTNRPMKGEFAPDLQASVLSHLPPNDNEVLVKVLFATVTIDDINISEGTELGGLPLSPTPSVKKPITPGIEFSGIVEQVGKNVTEFAIDDEVFGTIGFPFPRSGAWAEYCCVKERYLFKKPAYLSHAQAAAFAGSGVVCSAVFQNGAMNNNHQVLILGASGGIGTLAVQMAKDTGAHVIAVCSEKNHKLVLSLGADKVIDYHTDSFVDVLNNKKDHQMDFVLDFVGGKEIEIDALKVLKKTGQFKTIVGPVRYIGDQALGWLGISKMFAYVFWRWAFSRISGPQYQLVAGSKAAFPYFEKTLEKGSVTPVIDRTIDFSIEAIREAILYVRSHRASGKVVIKITAG